MSTISFCCPCSISPVTEEKLPSVKLVLDTLAQYPNIIDSKTALYEMVEERTKDLEKTNNFINTLEQGMMKHINLKAQLKK